MNKIKRDNGFTLIEVLAVIIIIGVLGAIAIPKLMLSTTTARQNADIATARQVKVALDRYQLENGVYPKKTELNAVGGAVTCASLIPKYISKLDASTTQQAVPDDVKGFDVAELNVDADAPTEFIIPDAKTRTIMIYLSNNGLAAEVRAYDQDFNILWTSAN
ncbi:MAG: type II secretion system protein [Desulfosporosinus sp.]|jgi:general secretion pathway protein G